MDIKKLKDFTDFMKEHDLVELEIEEDGRKIRLKKAGSDVPVVVSSMAHAPAQTGNFKHDTAVEPAKNDNTIEIKSPMVGTFYRAPAPNAKPFKEIGEAVKAGDTVCIIEAMKLMNEIKAEKSGKVVSIVAENGQPVEFGQLLYTLEPA